MATWNSTLTGKTILVGVADAYLEKIVKRYRDEKGMPASKPFILNKIISDYSKTMPIGELSRNMALLRLSFCTLSFNERDYINYGIVVRAEFKVTARDLIKEIRDFNKRQLRIVSNFRNIPNVIIHDFINIAKLNGEEFDEYYLKLNNNG
jgi:hypothetical protein